MTTKTQSKEKSTSVGKIIFYIVFSPIILIIIVFSPIILIIMAAKAIINYFSNDSNSDDSKCDSKQESFIYLGDNGSLPDDCHRYDDKGFGYSHNKSYITSDNGKTYKRSGGPRMFDQHPGRISSKPAAHLIAVLDVSNNYSPPRGQ